MTDFVKRQRDQKRIFETRGNVIWTSCYIDRITGTKVQVDGTRRFRKEVNRTRGKLKIKAEKKSTHIRSYYRIMRLTNHCSAI